LFRSNLAYITESERAERTWISGRDAHILKLGLSFVQSW
jgi:hypothetical protein